MTHIINAVRSGNMHTFEYTPSAGYSLKDILSDHGITLRSDCGGNGICRKCMVYVSKTDSLSTSDSSHDTSFIPVNSCSFYPDSDITVKIPDISIDNLPDNTGQNDNIRYSAISDSSGSIPEPDRDLYAAIDLGSTTISVSLYGDRSLTEKNSNSDKYYEIDNYSFFNPTLKYGADIISRQQASLNGNRENIMKLLDNALYDALHRIIARNRLSYDSLKRVCISGNTTMQHFLYGINCEDIASFPFITDRLSYDTYERDNCKVITLPSYSTFIGADIISGLYYINAADIDEPFLFLDLGTNAEMVLGNEGVFLCTSAAAGPAFEGTDISCGCAAIPGAIKKVKINKYVTYETIDNKNPVGICGSGILSLYSELLKHNIIDDSKTFSEQYIEDGFNVAVTPERQLKLTQKDIRELQLAIAAIRTGIQILFNKTGINADKLAHIYVSGSLGKALDTDILESIGLIPGADNAVYNKIILSGNTSLKGAGKALSDTSYKESMERILSLCSEVTLADEPDFKTVFLSNI